MHSPGLHFLPLRAAFAPTGAFVVRRFSPLSMFFEFFSGFLAIFDCHPIGAHLSFICPTYRRVAEQPIHGLRLETMDIHVLNHPLVDHKLTVLRDKNTPSSTFRELVSELVMLEAYEATRDIEVVDKPIETPVAPMIGKHIAAPAPIIVPVLRAGLGMLDGMTKMIPSAEVGFLGMKRDEENPTQQITYANRLPEDLTGRQCFLIDPMLATGGTLVAATHYLAERGAKDITAVCILGAPEGLKFVEENLDPSIKFKLVLCAVDEKLNDKCYIVPGLGDAGDRLYGVID